MLKTYPISHPKKFLILNTILSGKISCYEKESPFRHCFNLRIHVLIRDRTLERLVVIKLTIMTLPYSAFNLAAGRRDLKMDADLTYKEGGMMQQLKHYDFWISEIKNRHTLSMTVFL